MNELHFTTIVGLLIATIDFLDWGGHVNRYLKRLNKAFMVALISGVNPAEGDIRNLDVGSIFMFVFITNLARVLEIVVYSATNASPEQGMLNLIGAVFLMLILAAAFSLIFCYLLIIIFGIWQSYVNYYLDFNLHSNLVKAWLVLISPLALAFFPIILFLVVLITVSYGLISLFISILSLPRKGILGSLGLLIAASPFFL
jgi:hypothetical protein